MHLLLLIGVGGVERAVRPLRITDHSASGRQFLVVVWTIPVARPLPYVSRHVIETIWVGRILRNGSRPGPPILTRVLIGKVPLMGVGHPLAARTKRIAPDKRL